MPKITLARAIQGFALLALLPAFLAAGSDERQPPKPNYKLASKYSLPNVTSRSYTINVQANWIGKSDQFWYAYRTSKGTMYWRVDASQKTKTPLFDTEKLAEKLAELSRKPVDATNLSLSRSRISEDGAKFSFVYSAFSYEYDLKNDKLLSRGKASALPTGPGTREGFGRRRTSDADEWFEQEPQDTVKEEDKEDKTKEDKTKETTSKSKGRTFRVVAPDKKALLFTKDNDLYLSDNGKEKDAIRLTKNGEEKYGFQLFGGFGGGRGRQGTLPSRGITPLSSSIWSKDSKYFYAVRQDSRNVKELFVINSLANPRPTLEKYLYSMPGEDAIRKGELHVGTRTEKSIIHIQPKAQHESYSHIHWDKQPGELRFFRLDRLRRNLEFCAVDIASGKGRVLIAEGFENAPVDTDIIRPYYLSSSDELIWWSERTGWGHFYLYERNGKLKNAITSGSWRASAIVAIDEKARVLYFVGNAREKGENVYYRHLYSVKFDGTDLTLLDPGDNYHFSALSPNNKYVIDNGMRIDQCPESVLRDAKGNKIMDLETTDLSRLKEFGWSPPETFVVKAADGVTDLYGNMWKPFDFDAKKKYPIIAHVYPGPQQEGVTHTFATNSSSPFSNMRLAQLGFIVIQVGHRGGSPQRSKAYGSYGYYNLRDYGLEDKKYAIEQLGAKYPWIDLKKVGIFGHSGGGFMTAAALLQKPYNEFFTAGVASAGNHDNNIYNNYWSERYHGLKATPIKEEKKEEKKDKTKGPKDETPAAPPVKTLTITSLSTKETPVAPPPKVKFDIKIPTNAELAANLKGRLLLVHGELDNNVHPANTMRLADALIKANKRFDMLMLPATRHGFGTYSGYFQRRMEEFFAEHLLGDRRHGADMDDRDK